MARIVRRLAGRPQAPAGERRSETLMQSFSAGVVGQHVVGRGESELVGGVACTCLLHGICRSTSGIVSLSYGGAMPGRAAHDQACVNLSLSAAQPSTGCCFQQRASEWGAARTSAGRRSVRERGRRRRRRTGREAPCSGPCQGGAGPQVERGAMACLQHGGQVRRRNPGCRTWRRSTPPLRAPRRSKPRPMNRAGAGGTAQRPIKPPP